MRIIDLDHLTDQGKVHNLAGRERGENARAHFDLDNLDGLEEPVSVKIPDHVYGLSSSFFLGMFSRSIRNAGSQERFLQKYKFDVTDEVMQQIMHGLSRWSAIADKRDDA